MSSLLMTPVWRSGLPCKPARFLGMGMPVMADSRAIWVCCGLLLVSFALMFVRDERES